MSDKETISVYDAQARDYAKLTESDARDAQLDGFIALLPQGGTVLDLGCGPGHCAAVMAEAGLQVTATDASGEMVALAAAHPGVTALQAGFDDISGEDVYDGIWANFSLLHAPREKMPDYLAALAQALKPGGIFHIGMKSGTGSARDAIGRLYTYYRRDELEQLLQNAGLTVTAVKTGTAMGLDGTMAKWITLTAHD